MDDNKDLALLEWTDPELIDLGLSMDNVEADMGPSMDLFMGSES